MNKKSHRIEQAWSRLEDALRREKRDEKREIAIVVGAGISYASGLPKWDELSCRILSHAGLDFDLMNGELGLSIPAQLSMAKTRIRSKKQDWVKIVRSNLYEGYNKKVDEDENKPFDYRGKKPWFRVKKPWPEIAEFFENSNRTLTTIVDLCSIELSSENAEKEGKREFVKNDMIGAVLTYNLDSLIQYYDRAHHGSPRILRTVERASKERHAGKTNLYHLHGYLFPEANQKRHEAADKLVLTEEEYNQRTDDAYNFASSSILWALREFVCIFIGCSMTDELMRRSLYRSDKEWRSSLEAERKALDTPEKREKFDRNYERRRRRHFATFALKDNDCMNDYRESDMENLGVHPLWVKDFGEDLPDRLARLKTWLSPS